MIFRMEKKKTPQWKPNIAITFHLAVNKCLAYLHLDINSQFTNKPWFFELSFLWTGIFSVGRKQLYEKRIINRIHSACTSNHVHMQMVQMAELEISDWKIELVVKIITFSLGLGPMDLATWNKIKSWGNCLSPLFLHSDTCTYAQPLKRFQRADLSVYNGSNHWRDSRDSGWGCLLASVILNSSSLICPWNSLKSTLYFCLTKYVLLNLSSKCRASPFVTGSLAHVFPKNCH